MSDEIKSLAEQAIESKFIPDKLKDDVVRLGIALRVVGIMAEDRIVATIVMIYDTMLAKGGRTDLRDCAEAHTAAEKWYPDAPAQPEPKAEIKAE